MELLQPILYITVLLVASTSAQITSTGCGSTKACFRNPSDCTNAATCLFFLSYVENSGDASLVDFEIMGSRTGGSGWVAVGFSDDKMMGADSGVMCSKTDSIETVKTFYNEGEVNTVADASGLSNTAVSVADGVVSCTFSRQKSVVGNAQFFDLSTDYYLLMGSGPIADSGVNMQHETDPVASTIKVSFTSMIDVNAEETGSHSDSHESDGSHISSNVAMLGSVFGLLVALFI
ncbi:DOMON domain-containing protein FRRS1L-like [Glandiceps talaboti]